MTEPTASGPGAPDPGMPAPLPGAQPPAPGSKPPLPGGQPPLARSPAAGPPPAAVGYPVASQPALIEERKTGPGLLVRAIWFVFVGWWLTGIVSSVAWLAMITIIGLPLGIWLINRIPTALTLRPRTSYVWAWTDAQGYARTSEARIDQPPWWARGLWFVLVGWWASAIVMTVGWVLVILSSPCRSA